MTSCSSAVRARWVASVAVSMPWLQSLGLADRPDVLFSSPDGTLTEIAPLLDRIVGIDLDTGADVRALKAGIGSEVANAAARSRVIVGSQSGVVHRELSLFSVVEVATSVASNRNPSAGGPAAQVGLHGFAATGVATDTTFSMQMIDDWGIEDVMASALDLALRHGSTLAVLFDLAVLDPAFDSGGTVPGGLDVRRLLRAARACGRRPEVAAAGFVKAGSELNLAYAVLSFCAGLALRP